MPAEVDKHLLFFVRHDVVFFSVSSSFAITANVPPLDDGRGTKPIDKGLLAAGPSSLGNEPLSIEEKLDPGIRPAVKLLWEHGFDTIESCQGGEGHCF